jgi:hypothetical protein
LSTFHGNRDGRAVGISQGLIRFFSWPRYDSAIGYGIIQEAFEHQVLWLAVGKLASVLVISYVLENADALRCDGALITHDIRLMTGLLQGRLQTDRQSGIFSDRHHWLQQTPDTPVLSSSFFTMALKASIDILMRILGNSSADENNQGDNAKCQCINKDRACSSAPRDRAITTLLPAEDFVRREHVGDKFFVGNLSLV